MYDATRGLVARLVRAAFTSLSGATPGAAGGVGSGVGSGVGRKRRYAPAAAAGSLAVVRRKQAQGGVAPLRRGGRRGYCIGGALP